MDRLSRFVVLVKQEYQIQKHGSVPVQGLLWLDLEVQLNCLAGKLDGRLQFVLTLKDSRLQGNELSLKGFNLQWRKAQFGEEWKDLMANFKRLSEFALRNQLLRPVQEVVEKLELEFGQIERCPWCDLKHRGDDAFVAQQEAIDLLFLQLHQQINVAVVYLFSSDFDGSSSTLLSFPEVLVELFEGLLRQRFRLHEVLCTTALP